MRRLLSTRRSVLVGLFLILVGLIFVASAPTTVVHAFTSDPTVFLGYPHVPSATVPAATPEANPVYPGADWQWVQSPERMGWDKEKLAEAQVYAEQIGSAAVMIVDDGLVVEAWGDVTREYKCHSMRKSLLSALYGIAVADGKIDLSHTLAEVGIDDSTPLTEVEKGAKISDLLKARSGVYIPAAGEAASMVASRPERGSHPPGTFWYYNNWDFNALGTIFDRYSDEENIYRAFDKYVAEPIGMQEFQPAINHYDYVSTSAHPYYGFRMNTRDLARFGLLFLREGRWGEEQIIPADWVHESTANHSQTGPDGGYGYMWWTGQGKGLFPGVDVGGHSFRASGYGGHELIILPEHDLVLVHRADTYAGKTVSQQQIGVLLYMILDAAGKRNIGDPPILELAAAKRTVGTDLVDVLINGEIWVSGAGERVSITFRPDGGLFIDSNEQIIDRGKWSVEGADFCVQMESVPDQERQCGAVIVDKDTLSFYDARGFLSLRAHYATMKNEESAKVSGLIKVDEAMLERFEKRLEDLRLKHRIPGMSVAIVQNQDLLWAQGFGYADVENRIAAVPDTPYHLASITKPFAAIVLMQLAEEGVLNLDDPISDYGIELGEPGKITIRHLLTHTSEGTPGERYQYSGDRFGLLGGVIEFASGRGFGELLVDQILEPLELSNTAPDPGGCAQLAEYEPCVSVNENIARPYVSYRATHARPGFYQDGYFSPAAGLISSVTDLAKFDTAIDQGLLLPAEAVEQMFSPAIANKGTELPYGLGWFTQNFQGMRLIWHYGHWPPSVSSLMLKLPEHNLTFIILANTDMLSRPYGLGTGSILKSPVALAFLRTFIFEPSYGEAIPDIDWQNEPKQINRRLSQVTDFELKTFLTLERMAHRKLENAFVEVEQAQKEREARMAKDISSAVLNSYVGIYLVPETLGGGHITVTRTDDRLLIVTNEGNRLEIFPASATAFFTDPLNAGQNVEVRFMLDEGDKVLEMLVKIEGDQYRMPFLGAEH